LLSWSEDLTQSDWIKQQTTISANSTISPDGTTNADKLIVNNGAAGGYAYQVKSTTSGTIYTGSFYIKAGGVNYTKFYTNISGSYNEAVINLITGAITNSDFAITPTTQNVGNGWYCINYTVTSGGGQVVVYIDGGSTSTGGGYTGNGVDGVFIWGAQVEASSYPTSYIPTTSASATRVADFDTSAGSSGNFGSLTPTGTKAVLYWELQFHSGSVTENINIGGFRNGTTNQYGMYYWGANANKNFGFNSWAGDSYGITGANSLFDGQVHKIAGVFDFNNFTNNVLFIDGVKKTISQTLNTTLQRSANVVSLNSPDYQFQGNKCLLKEFLYFNQNLSDAELASLTTL
jgi:hypothetical protein